VLSVVTDNSIEQRFPAREQSRNSLYEGAYRLEAVVKSFVERHRVIWCVACVWRLWSICACATCEGGGGSYRRRSMGSSPLYLFTLIMLPLLLLLPLLSLISPRHSSPFHLNAQLYFSLPHQYSSLLLPNINFLSSSFPFRSFQQRSADMHCYRVSRTPG
jgi:hypothetical protein